MPVKPMTLLCFISKTSFFRFYFLPPPTRTFTSLVPLISHPALSSARFLIFENSLSLFSCHRGKQNTVAMETAHRERARREAAYETSSVETEAYIWPHPVWWVQPSMNIVFLSFLRETLRGRWSDRQSEKMIWKQREREREGNEGMRRKMHGVWPGWY